MSCKSAKMESGKDRIKTETKIVYVDTQYQEAITRRVQLPY